MSYPAYEEFNLPRWPGTQPVPVGWGIRRLKFAVTCNDEALSEGTDPDYEMAYVDIAGVNLFEGITTIETLRFEEAPSRARRIVRHGDTIISTVRTYLKAIAPIEEPPANLIASTGFAVVRPRGFIDSGFLGYALQGTGFINAVVAHSTGVSYPAINPTTLVCLPFGYPEDKNEQQQIAAFLNWKTGQIDALIERKHKLLKKLEEKRLAIILHAVTRGLDPATLMRDSGIPWIGQVPHHWEVLQIGRVIRLQRGVDITKDEQEEGDVPVVSSGGIGSYHRVALVEGPGVIVGRKGTAGALYYVDSDYWPHDTTLYVRDFLGNHPRFVYYKLLSMDLASYDTGTANPTVNRNVVHRVKVAWPPLSEQVAIYRHLDRASGRIDEMAGNTTNAIARLTEYRSALITAATMGTIDVRKVVIPRLGA